MNAPFPFAGEMFAALSAFLWAVGAIMFARLPQVTPFAINLGKNVAATLCFVVLLLVVTGMPWPFGMPREAVFWFALSGIAGLTVCDTLLIRSLQSIGPQRMSLVMTVHPIIVAVFAMAPPFEEIPPPTAWLGMGVCLFGVALAVLEKPVTPTRNPHATRGLIDAGIAAVLQATGILLARYAQGVALDHSAAEGATVRLMFGSLGAVLIGLPALRILSFTRELRAPRVMRWLFVASFIGTFLGIWFNQLGLRWTEHTGVATVLNAMMPVYLIPLSAIFLGQRHTKRGWIATLVAVGGVALMTLY